MGLWWETDWLRLGSGDLGSSDTGGAVGNRGWLGGAPPCPRVELDLPQVFLGGVGAARGLEKLLIGAAPPGITPESNSVVGLLSASSSEDEKDSAGAESPMGSATTALLALGVSRPMVLGVDVRAIIWSYREVRETAEIVDLASSSSPSPRDCFRIHLSKTESLPAEAGGSFGFSCRLSAGTTFRGVTDRDRNGSLSRPC